MKMVLCAQLLPFGAIVFIDDTPPLVLPTWEEAVQLGAEINSCASGVDYRELATRQLYALSDLERVAAECVAARQWARQGQRYGQELKETGQKFSVARAQALRLQRLARRALVHLVAVVGDPGLALSTTLSIRETALVPISLGRSRALLRPGMPTRRPPYVEPHTEWVIGIDPGGSTGLVLCCGEVLIESAIATTLQDTCSVCERWLLEAQDSGSGVSAIVIERFGNMQFMNADRKHSLWQEGIGHLLGELYGVPIIEQSPQVVSLLVEHGASKLAARYDHIPASIHERDALAHVYVYLQGQKAQRAKRKRR